MITRNFLGREIRPREFKVVRIECERDRCGKKIKSVWQGYNICGWLEMRQQLYVGA